MLRRSLSGMRGRQTLSWPWWVVASGSVAVALTAACIGVALHTVSTRYGQAAGPMMMARETGAAFEATTVRPSWVVPTAAALGFGAVIALGLTIWPLARR